MQKPRQTFWNPFQSLDNNLFTIYKSLRLLTIPDFLIYI